MGPAVGKLFRFSGYLLTVLLAAAQISPAQVEPEPSSITGMVFMEEENKPAGRVLVKVKSLESGLCVGVLTDENGEFQAEGLTPGDYEVFAEKPGFESTRITAKTHDTSELRVYFRTQREQANRADMLISVRELQIPDKARAAFEKATGRLQNQDYAGSLAHLQKAVAAFPGFYEAYYNIGAVQLRLHQDEEAMQSLQKAIDLSQGKLTLAEFTMGLLLWQTHRFEEAVVVLRRALEQDANYAKGYLMLGGVLYDQGWRAEKLLREAELRSPEMPSSYLIHAKIDYIGRGTPQAC
jgi:tetratricopeptide (TPR) repeat protein